MATKVLNWLQQKMRPQRHYFQMDQNKSKSSALFMGVTIGAIKDMVQESITEPDTEALLLHDVPMDGFLAIGTFGYHHPSLFLDPCLDEEKHDMDEQFRDEEGEAAAVETAVAIPPSGPPVVIGKQVSKSSSIKKSLGEYPVELVIPKHEEKEKDAFEVQEEPLLGQEQAVYQARTTLADLFAAENFALSEARTGSYKGGGNVVRPIRMPSLCIAKEQQEYEEGCDKAKSFKTKKNLGGLMKKMLRKKVHPEKHGLRSDECSASQPNTSSYAG